jgi:hypothetical protein
MMSRPSASFSVIDQRGRVNEFTVDLAAERGLREAGADRGGHFGDGHRMLVLSNRTVRQTYRNHCVLRGADRRGTCNNLVEK